MKDITTMLWAWNAARHLYFLGARGSQDRGSGRIGLNNTSSNYVQMLCSLSTIVDALFLTADFRHICTDAEGWT